MGKRARHGADEVGAVASLPDQPEVERSGGRLHPRHTHKPLEHVGLNQRSFISLLPLAQ